MNVKVEMLSCDGSLYRAVAMTSTRKDGVLVPQRIVIQLAVWWYSSNGAKGHLALGDFMWEFSLETAWQNARPGVSLIFRHIIAELPEGFEVDNIAGLEWQQVELTRELF